jgi:hypothetical protein
VAEPLRLLVCGGRGYAEWVAACAALDDVLSRRPIAVVIAGGARGADALAVRWAEDRHLAALVFPADWTTYGKRAGFIRNRQMLREGRPTFVVAFPGGTGTADMVRASREAGLKVWRPYG